MWRELKLLGEKKPLVASMADVAASGGYYMAMAAGVIVAENLTLTGSIGVVTGACDFPWCALSILCLEVQRSAVQFFSFFLYACSPGKFNLKELYERVGYTKEIISRGRFAELDAEQRPFK